MPSTLKPRPRISSTVGVSHSSRRAHSIKDAPASASPSAISRPRPREPPVTIATRPERSNNSLMVGMSAGLYLPSGRSVNWSATMIHVHDPLVENRFLAEAVAPGDVFTREDLTEEHRL